MSCQFDFYQLKALQLPTYLCYFSMGGLGSGLKAASGQASWKANKDINTLIRKAEGLGLLTSREVSGQVRD